MVRPVAVPEDGGAGGLPAETAAAGGGGRSTGLGGPEPRRAGRVRQAAQQAGACAGVPEDSTSSQGSGATGVLAGVEEGPCGPQRPEFFPPPPSPRGLPPGTPGTPSLASKSAVHGQFFKTKVCSFWEKNKCLRGRGCKFAHGDLELQDTPNLTNTALCRNAISGRCTNADCTFAHSWETLRATKRFYKTIMCSFYRYGRCRLGELCRHAHSRSEQEQARRRQRLEADESTVSSFQVGNEAWPRQVSEPNEFSVVSGEDWRDDDDFGDFGLDDGALICAHQELPKGFHGRPSWADLQDMEQSHPQARTEELDFECDMWERLHTMPAGSQSSTLQCLPTQAGPSASSSSSHSQTLGQAAETRRGSNAARNIAQAFQPQETFGRRKKKGGRCRSAYKVVTCDDLPDLHEDSLQVLGYAAPQGQDLMKAGHYPGYYPGGARSRHSADMTSTAFNSVVPSTIPSQDLDNFEPTPPGMWCRTQSAPCGQPGSLTLSQARAQDLFPAMPAIAPGSWNRTEVEQDSRPSVVPPYAGHWQRSLTSPAEVPETASLPWPPSTPVGIQGLYTPASQAGVGFAVGFQALPAGVGSQGDSASSHCGSAARPISGAQASGKGSAGGRGKAARHIGAQSAPPPPPQPRDVPGAQVEKDRSELEAELLKRAMPSCYED